MCLWLLTACFGLLPTNQIPTVIYVPAAPPPILIPTAAPTTTTAATTTSANMTMPSNMTMPPGNMTMPPSNMTTPPANMTMPPANMTMPPVNMTKPPGNMTMQPGTPTTNAPTTAAPVTPAPATTGSIPIDPRLGTTPASSAAYQLPITSYSRQVASDDTAVRFPREKRQVIEYPLNIKDFIMQRVNSEHKIRKRATTCSCVPTGTCKTSTPSNFGAGMLDVRIVTPVSQCLTGQEYCCVDDAATAAPIACGKVQTVPATGVTPSGGQANFGEFPWQAIILSKQNDYLAGGVLIDSLNVLTVTHRLVNYVVSGTAPNVKVRLGEWDAATTSEVLPFQEYNVQKVFTHPSYNANTLQYDITVLRLASAVPFTPAAGAATTINRACLPPSATTVYNGQRCMVAGWGKNMFGVTGQYQQILKRVEVPIVAPATCQTQLQTARLGSAYVLDSTSFVCAGGEANKDSCTGDGGSGLVCQVNGSWVVVGLVAWGLGCANANVPAAYVNIAGLLPWIQTQVASA